MWSGPEHSFHKSRLPSTDTRALRRPPAWPPAARAPGARGPLSKPNSLQLRRGAVPSCLPSHSSSWGTCSPPVSIRAGLQDRGPHLCPEACNPQDSVETPKAKGDGLPRSRGSWKCRPLWPGRDACEFPPGAEKGWPPLSVCPEGALCRQGNPTRRQETAGPRRQLFRAAERLPCNSFQGRTGAHRWVVTCLTQ